MLSGNCALLRYHFWRTGLFTPKAPPAASQVSASAHWL